MSFRKEFVRNEDYKNLKALRTQAINAVNTLKAINTNINNLKTKVVTNATGYYVGTDTDDINAIITEIQDEITGINFS